MRLRSLIFMVALGFLTVFASTGTANAQDYGGVGSETQDRGDGGDEVLGTVTSRSPEGARATNAAPATLPVTGGDLVGIAVLGIALVGGGTVIVRRTRRTAVAA